MEHWLDAEDIQKLVYELNPQLQTGKQFDENWEKLKRERSNPFDKTVKTKSPTLLEFEKNYSFVYRRYDGAQWHTELRDIDTEYRKTGLTPDQHILKDRIDTIMVLSDGGFKIKWITPVDQTSDRYDPTYQLLMINGSWYCCINNKIYATSNSRKPPNREYVEHTFSTKNPPVFTLESTNEILDRLVK